MRSVSAAVASLKSELAAALVGGPDPSETRHALDDLRTIEACPLWEGQEKLAAFATAIRDPSSFPGTSRPVVLARGQRYLLSLSILMAQCHTKSAASRSIVRQNWSNLCRGLPKLSPISMNWGIPVSALSWRISKIKRVSDLRRTLLPQFNRVEQ